MKREGVESLAFFCSTRMVVLIGYDEFLEQVGNLNVTYTRPGVVRHYHIHFKEAGQRKIGTPKRYNLTRGI